MEQKFKVGQKVWVNEHSQSGKFLLREWYGTIIKIHPGDPIANVRDDNPKSFHYTQVFTRWLDNLIPKEK